MNKSDLEERLLALAAEMISEENKRAEMLGSLAPGQVDSARNLIHYLTLRSKDMRMLQDDLHIAGLSSLASSESHILRQVQAILQVLGVSIESGVSACDYYFGRKTISDNAAALFGNKKDPGIPYLMVTFDSGFADNYELVKNLLQTGMNVARINCAHDDPETWLQMIGMVKKGSEETGVPCKIYMDLGGPKLRTVIRVDGKPVKKITVEKGQDLVLAEADEELADGIVLSCEEKGLIGLLKDKSRILFDDGLIEAVVVGPPNKQAHIRVVRVSDRKQELRSGKGMNFPGTQLDMPSLTGFDISVLPFIAKHADLVGYSFIRTPADLRLLQKQLSVYPNRPKIIIKVETPESVAHLPYLILQGMHEEHFGVMIARGDLAVEIGFERMSEIQEEILWICEAAHVPVIWATQVLETLNKSGLATRSEVTDAYSAAHAECVLVNKGTYVIDVLRTLKDILQRSGGHHVKKRYTFRSMQIAKRFLEN
jgi:pyruvate kinase